MSRIYTIGAVLLIASAGSGASQSDPEQAAFFETKVRPLLEARCFKCHSAEAPKPKGGLRLDSREAILKGGDRGSAFVVGKPDASLIVKAISRIDPDLAMPPKEPLPEGERAILVEWIKRGAPWSAAKTPRAKKEKPITDQDRAWWAFQPIREPAVPAEGDGWARNELDRFILKKLKSEGLAPAPEAGRVALIRRATFDLHGLPPTPEEVEAFVADPSPDAYEKLVDRLLASPRYGEREARKWLDLVRYAESDGYKQDAFRPNSWPYRDYVIRSLNADKPYDRFVLEQLAGDEVAPDDPDVIVATGFLRHGIYEYNQRNASGQWKDVLNDITDVTGDVFLGLGMGCARCHDHKFDPILQSDYFRLQSFFAGILWRDDLPLATPAQRAEAEAKRRVWEEKTSTIRAQIAEIEKSFIANAERSALSKFLPEYQEIMRKPAAVRTPRENQIFDLVNRQVVFEHTTIDGKIKGAVREKWSALKRQLAEFDALKPREFTPALAATDVGPQAPPVHIPGDDSRPPIEPAALTVLGGAPLPIEATPTSSGRRTALARWLTGPDHPLTSRVMANRLWQHHFGRGLSTASSDFGRLGEKPSHPELLDWLASRFMKTSWSLKSMHRLLMTSATYRQSHAGAAEARLKDPENRWLWKMTPRRLEAEEVRDAMLAVSGELDPAQGGPSVDPNLPRRTIYTKVLRNTRDPLLDAFDAPEAFSSVASRNSTTTATQSLLLINGRWTLERAQAFARRLNGDHVEQAYRRALGRPPSPAESEAAHAFLRRAAPEARSATADMPLVQTMPDRGGQAARIRDGRIEDRLRLADNPELPDADFTVEAIVILDSIHPDASVRVIASQWDGANAHPGWSLGVTGEKSKHQPRNVILQISGSTGYHVVASDLRLELHKTHYVGASVKIAGDPVATFYVQDLSDPEAQLRSAAVRHPVTGGYRSKAALMIGGREGQPGHGWDGLIDEVRLSRGALAREQILILEGAAPSVAAHWKFEVDGFFRDSAGIQKPLGRPTIPRGESAASETSLVDFCHALLNSNEFFYVD